MKRMNKVIFVVLMMITPTLQLAAKESESEVFKQQLLEEIQQEIQDLSPAEIRKIIHEVEKQLTEYVEHYEHTPEEHLLTKSELTLKERAHEVHPEKLARLQKYSDKSTEQLILEELNPKLKLYSDDEYRYNEETKEFEFMISKDELFKKERDSMLQVDNAALPYLEKGDVLINLDNGSSSGLFKWGHAGLMYYKDKNPNLSKTIEAPGQGQVVQFVNYKTAWHDNKDNRIAYNYAPRIYKTNKPEKAAENARQYLGKPYGLLPVLGDTRSIYCTELVFLAYRSQGVKLGNGMDIGSWGILLPKNMYCDPKLEPYYLQKFNGRVC